MVGLWESFFSLLFKFVGARQRRVIHDLRNPGTLTSYEQAPSRSSSTLVSWTRLCPRRTSPSGRSSSPPARR
eukprot:12763468-Alexandrium_andersonii.AAC.1